MTIIRPMQPADKEAVLAMMEVFYTSPAVFTNGSATIYSNDFEACVGDNPYLEGYMFEENGQITEGYAYDRQKLFYGIWPVPVSGWKTFISKKLSGVLASEASFLNLLETCILRQSFVWK